MSNCFELWLKHHTYNICTYKICKCIYPSFCRSFFLDGEFCDDVYLMRPFPSMWNCRVIHPFGLDPLAGDVNSLQGFCRCLEILTYLRSEASRLGMQCGE